MTGFFRGTEAALLTHKHSIFFTGAREGRGGEDASLEPQNIEQGMMNVEGGEM